MKEQICDKCAGGHSMEWDWRFLVYSDLSINSKKNKEVTKMNQKKCKTVCLLPVIMTVDEQNH
ncbi:hypothetical protein [Geobacillus stearothermophilus]